MPSAQPYSHTDDGHGISVIYCRLSRLCLYQELWTRDPPSKVAVWLRLKCRGTPRCCVVRAPSHCRCGLPAWFRAKLSAWGTTSPSQYLRTSSRFAHTSGHHTFGEETIKRPGP